MIAARERRLRPIVRRGLEALAEIFTPGELQLAAAMGGQVAPDRLIQTVVNRLRALQPELEAALRDGTRPLERQFPATTPADLAAHQVAELIREIGPRQLAAVREQLAILMEQGPRPDLVRAIGQATGLTKRQAAQVGRIVQAQLAGGASRPAAMRAGRAAATRLLDFRTRLIARTEAVRYTNDLVQLRAETVAAGGRTVRRQWLSARDGNVDGGNPLGPCALNDNGELVGLQETFRSGHSRPPAHPGCRCVIELLVEE